MRVALKAYALRNHAALQLTGSNEPHIASLNAVFRTAPSGALLIELVAQFVETDPASRADTGLGGIPVRGGSTIVVGVDGVVRYVISKPLPGAHLLAGSDAAAHAALRITRQTDFVASLDERDARTPYMSKQEYRTRMKARMSLRSLHEGL
jgi:hypothetical protein